MTITNTKKTTKAKPRNGKQTADEKYLGLTEQEFNRFREACRRTLNTIAHEVMSSGVVEVRGKDLTRERAIEVILPEGRLFTYTLNSAQTPRMRKDWVRLYDERIQPMLDKHCGTPAFNRMMKKVFPATLKF